MFRLYLKEDAFLLPKEKKDLKREYKALYTNLVTTPNYSYCKETKFERSLQKNQRSNFQNEFNQLLDAYKTLGDKNDFNTPALIANITLCKQQIFEVSYSGIQTNDFFNTIKYNLETIWFALTFDRNLALKQKKSIYQYLCGSLNVCAPGLYTHIEDICNSLNNDVSLERWLTDFRTNIIRIYADQHIAEYKVSDGNSIHVYNAFLNYALNSGLNPLSSVNKHQDPFSIANTQIEPQTLIQFTHHFQDKYAHGILDVVCNSFIYEINQCRKFLALKEQNGWLPYSKDLYNKMTELSKIIGLTEDDGIFFDLTEEYSHMRFNPTQFQIAFLSACKKQSKIFLPDCWHETILEDNYKFCYAALTSMPRITWIENSKGEVLNWQNLPEDPEPIILLGRILSQLSSDLWHQAINWTVKSLEQCLKNSSDLGKLLACVNVKSKVIFIVNRLLYSRHSSKLLTSPTQLSQLLDNLDSNMKWKMDIVFEYLIKEGKVQAPKEFLLDAALHDDQKSLQNILEKTNLFDSKKDSIALAAIVATNKNSNMLKLLLEHKLDIQEANKEGSLSKIIATNGDIVMFKILYNYDQTKKNVQTAAEIAVTKEHVDLLRFLLDSKVDLTYKNAEGQTLIHMAARMGQHAVIKLFAEYNYIIDALDMYGFSTVYLAVGAGNINTVRTLVECKANVNKGSMNSPAVAAAHDGNLQMLETLFEYKADLHCVDLLGRNLAHSAATQNNKVMEFLIKHKVDINKQDDDKETPVQVAAKFGSDKVIRILAENKVDLNQFNENGYSLGTLATLRDHVNVIKVLAEYKVDLTKEDKSKRTIPYVAVTSKSIQIIIELLHQHMSLDTFKIHNVSLIQAAEKSGNWDIVIPVLVNLRNNYPLHRKDKKILNDNRELLGDNFMSYLNKTPLVDKLDLARKVLNGDNALGVFFNNPPQELTPRSIYRLFRSGVSSSPETLRIQQFVNQFSSEERKHTMFEKIMFNFNLR